MMRTMGYIIEDANELYQLIQTEVENKFLSGDYKLKVLNVNGQHFTVNFILNFKEFYDIICLKVFKK